MTQPKVALITGAGRGIGAATAIELAKMNIRVAVNYLSNHDSAEKVIQTIRTNGGEAIKLQADVCNAEQVAQMTEDIVKQWGKIDILVSNANIPFVIKPFLEISWTEFSQKLNGEIQAEYLLSQSVLPIMKENHYGRIVYVASGAAKTAVPNFITHGTAKAALVQFARYIAVEFGKYDITANIISPALTETDASRGQVEILKEQYATSTPLNRIGQPDDIAKAISMFVSEQSQFITGSYIPVDGGKSMV
ncbi:SDR family oxidoreductase [Shimazuella alba]|uniref:SDR family oxidoreductase n=1 Tax=Shimazuella alba TaxID=2690964 RepID=A0A6I4VS08_9BACL|nr:SDR family oxidoreductase [Shimazuella alba]MXQ52696.1 SDR family oxidoreductase [Shimazuella alba]